MSKKSKAEPTTAVAIESEATSTPASVDVGNDASLHRLGRGRVSVDTQRSATAPTIDDTTTTTDGQAVTPPTVPANDVPAPATTAENDGSRQSLTAQFHALNEKSVEGTIQKGRVIKQGQERLKQQWKAWVVEDLHLTLYAAGLYVHISDHPLLSDPKYWKYLPIDYRTLYELSQIATDKLLDYLAKGDVHHDLARDDAVKLKLDGSDKQEKKPLPSPEIPDELGVLQKIARYFRSDKEWQAYIRQNPRPNELPGKEDIEASLRWVEMKRAKLNGVR